MNINVLVTVIQWLFPANWLTIRLDIQYILPRGPNPRAPDNVQVLCHNR